MRSALALLLVAATAHAAPNVLLCAADANGGAADLQKKLGASNAFAAVDLVDCSKQTPTAQTLAQYEGVLTFSDIGYADRATLGSNLADYVDKGGGVVLMQFALSAGFNIELTGRWATDNYNCLQPGKILYQLAQSKQAPNDPNNPIVQGVTAIGSQYRSNPTLNMAHGAASLWDYTDGAPLVCQMSYNGHPRVDLNFYPGPPPNFYTEGKAGDGATLAKNALLAVAGGFNPLKGMPNPAAFPDTGTGAVSNALTVTYTNTSMMAQTVTSSTVGGANAGDFLVTRAPQLPQSVAPMATLSVDLVFQPTIAGARTATLSLGVTGQASTADVALKGNAIPSSVKVTPFPIAVGGTQQGMPITKDVTIANVGQGKVTINSAQVTAGQAAYTIVNAPAFPVALVGGGAFAITVQFAPQMDGVTSGTLTITSNDPNTPTINVPLSGYAGPPGLALDAGSIAFGTVNLGASASQVVTATNTGFSDLVVTDIALSGANAGDFSVDKMMAVGTIGAQMAQPFTVSFKPLALGVRSATLTVTSNAGTKSLGLFGQGTMSSLAVMPNAVQIAPAHVKTASAPSTVTVSNGGNGTLKVSAINFSGNDAASFSLKGGATPPFSVGPNASTTVSVIATPQKFGKLSATMTVVSDVGSADVALAGEGTAPVVTLSPAMLDFGSQRVATMSMAQPVVIANTGTDDLTVGLIGIAGADANDFTSMDLPQVPLMLHPGDKSTFHVVFDPSKSAIESAEVQLLSDDPANMMAKLPMTGVGTQPGVKVTPMLVDFGNVMVSTVAAPKMVTIANTGDLPITINSVALGGPAQAQFTVDKKGPFDIAKGDSATLAIGYSPLTMGLHSATVTINAQGLVAVTIKLQGTGVGPSLLVAPTSLDFGTVLQGLNSDVQMVGLKNGGTTPIALDSIKSSDPAFAVDTSMTRMMLAPNEQTTFAVTFHPTEQKAYSAQITVAATGQASPITIAVKGVGSEDTKPDRCNSGCCCRFGGRSPSRTPLALIALLLVPLVCRRRTKR